jgi:NAD(P)-dependent dehydrogenase (short-subunit alcohol dehydrogenase family)
MAPLSNKVALVTGASAPHGIGRAIALKLSALGAIVVVTDQDGSVEIDATRHDRSALLDELVAQINTPDKPALGMTLDVTQASEIQHCVAQSVARFGRLDILVNNAGSLAGSKAFMSTTPQEWDTSFRVNLLGPMMLAQAVIPQMIAQGGGRIINIGSTGSLGAEPGFGAYTTMKHGLVGLSKTLAAEFGPNGILCNTVCPGYIETDMHMAANDRLAREAALSIDAIKQQRYAPVALRSAGLPIDVANAVAFLAGPDANYITGINLPVTGGVPFGI